MHLPLPYLLPSDNNRASCDELCKPAAVNAYEWGRAEIGGEDLDEGLIGGMCEEEV